MIEELYIKNIGVINEAKLEFSKGFTVLTGETGAGKTAIVSALSLILGARAETSIIRNGKDSAIVSGVIINKSVNSNKVTDIITNAGGEISDDELIITRNINTEGRSRAIAGGVPVPVGVLAECARVMISVHGQSDQIKLKQSSAVREILDSYLDLDSREKYDEYRSCWKEYTSISKQLSEIVDSENDREKKKSWLSEIIAKLSEINPQKDELAKLDERISFLENIEGLRSGLIKAQKSITGEKLSQGDIRDAIDIAAKELESLKHLDNNINNLFDSLENIKYLLNDFCLDLAGYLENFDSTGEYELENLHDRKAQLLKLCNFIGEDYDGVIYYANNAENIMADLQASSSLKDELSELKEIKYAQLKQLAISLSDARNKTATALSEAVSIELNSLAMPETKLVFDVISTDSFTSYGADNVSLRIANNSVSTVRDIHKGASGGELSRIMLALEVVLAGKNKIPTFIFDEVDAGIGGATAIEVAKRLARLAKNAQVIVVTHLAQVAAFADRHIQIVKDNYGGVSESSVRILPIEERHNEIARLLSGMSDSETAKKHAAELLLSADNFKKINGIKVNL